VRLETSDSAGLACLAHRIDCVTHSD
jgi:hypothetical protein